MEEIEHTCCCCVSFQIVCVLSTTDPAVVFAVVFATAEDPHPFFYIADSRLKAGIPIIKTERKLCYNL